jgi:hypothetical protein
MQLIRDAEMEELSFLTVARDCWNAVLLKFSLELIPICSRPLSDSNQEHFVLLVVLSFQLARV